MTYYIVAGRSYSDWEQHRSWYWTVSSFITVALHRTPVCHVFLYVFGGLKSHALGTVKCASAPQEFALSFVDRIGYHKWRANLFHLSRLWYLRLGSAINWRGLNMSLIASSHQHSDNTQERDDTNSVCCGCALDRQPLNSSSRASAFCLSVCLSFVIATTRTSQLLVKYS